MTIVPLPFGAGTASCDCSSVKTISRVRLRSISVTALPSQVPLCGWLPTMASRSAKPRRGGSFTEADNLTYLGVSNDQTMTVWFEGEVWLDATSTETFGLIADDVAFIDLARPGTFSFTRVMENDPTHPTANVATLGAKGIRINCTAPGVTDTPILDQLRSAYGQEFLDSFQTPLGRVAGPDEQATVLVFLNSRAAGYITGQVIWVDGGSVAERVFGDVMDARQASGGVQ